MQLKYDMYNVSAVHIDGGSTRHYIQVYLWHCIGLERRILNGNQMMKNWNLVCLGHCAQTILKCIKVQEI